MGSFVAEFWEFLRVRKKFWLAPLMITMARRSREKNEDARGASEPSSARGEPVWNT